MKTKQLFWGLFFVTLGILFVLEQYSSFYIDWYFVSDFWPIIFVLFGLIVLFKETKLKPVFSGLAGLWLAVILYSFLNITCTGNFVFDIDDDYTVSVFSEEWNNDTEYAELRVSGGMGKFSIVDGTEKLVYARSKGSFGEYDFYSKQDGNKAFIKLMQDKDDFHFFDEDFRNRLEIKLNKIPTWDLDFELGAASTYLDLSDYKIRNLDFESGATKTKIKLGNLCETTELDVKMGVASLELEIPETSGCKISGDMVLVIKSLEGFRKVENHDTYYVTDNYEESKNKIDLYIESGVSSLKIKRW